MALIPRGIADFSQQITPTLFAIIDVVKVDWAKIDSEIAQVQQSHHSAAFYSLSRQLLDLIKYCLFERALPEVIFTAKTRPMPPTLTQSPHFIRQLWPFI
ncbi:Uncharacterised protein [Vibrio cholerae]|nr:Uncharacterised protein [Vibrio cholerae]CSB28053.1 Uncharacterised protein [Vibrio cholerae]